MRNVASDDTSRMDFVRPSCVVPASSGVQRWALDRRSAVGLHLSDRECRHRLGVGSDDIPAPSPGPGNTQSPSNTRCAVVTLRRGHSEATGRRPRSRGRRPAPAPPTPRRLIAVTWVAASGGRAGAGAVRRSSGRDVGDPCCCSQRCRQAQPGDDDPPLVVELRDGDLVLPHVHPAVVEVRPLDVGNADAVGPEDVPDGADVVIEGPPVGAPAERATPKDERGDDSRRFASGGGGNGGWARHNTATATAFHVLGPRQGTCPDPATGCSRVEAAERQRREVTVRILAHT